MTTIPYAPPLRPRLGLRRRTMMVMAAALVAVAAATATSCYNHWRLRQYAAEAIDHDARRSALASRIALELSHCITGENEFLLSLDDPAARREALARWQTGQAAVVKSIAEYQELPLSDFERQKLARWHSLGDEQLQMLTVAAALPNADEAAQRTLRESIAAGQPALRAAVAAAQSMAQDRMAVTQQRGDHLQTAIESITWLVVLRGLIATSIFGLLGLWFSRRVLTLTSSLSSAIARYISGDLEARAPADCKDELGVVASQFNALASIEQASRRLLNEQISRQKQVAEELTQAKNAALVASRSKTEFLANMSHEIRTPMTAILGFADLLVERAADAESVEAANTIKRNGTHLLEIINDILDISKIEAGRFELETLPASPFQIVADVKALMAVRAETKGLPLVVEYRGTIPQTIQTDPTRLRQILVNLLGNAIKFTESGGVGLITSLVEEPGTRPRLCFEVKDTGIGMTQEQLSRLFQPFHQADTSTSRRFGGSGLGLAISKRLAEMLGGTIEVHSALGRGSTFTLLIATGPLDGVRRYSREEFGSLFDLATPPAPLPPPPALRGRVLLAEDGVDNGRLITAILQRAGAEVTIAENGQIAVEKALAGVVGPELRHPDAKEPFDVILMDMQMPLVDGYEATRRLRQAGYRGPIIALTAHAMSQDRQKCLDAGCDDYAAKPINRDKLVGLVAKYLGVASS